MVKNPLKVALENQLDMCGKKNMVEKWEYGKQFQTGVDTDVTLSGAFDCVLNVMFFLLKAEMTRSEVTRSE